MKPQGTVPTWALVVGVVIMILVAALFYGTTVFSVGLTSPAYMQV